MNEIVSTVISAMLAVMAVDVLAFYFGDSIRLPTVFDGTQRFPKVETLLWRTGNHRQNRDVIGDAGNGACIYAIYVYTVNAYSHEKNAHPRTTSCVTKPNGYQKISPKRSTHVHEPMQCQSLNFKLLNRSLVHIINLNTSEQTPGTSLHFHLHLVPELPPGAPTPRFALLAGSRTSYTKTRYPRREVLA